MIMNNVTKHNEAPFLCAKCLVNMEVMRLDTIFFNKCPRCETVLIDKSSYDNFIKFLAIENKTISFLNRSFFY